MVSFTFTMRRLSSAQRAPMVERRWKTDG